MPSLVANPREKSYGSWIARLPDIFKQHHLEMTVVESKRVQDWHRNLIMENWCILAEEYASAALDCNGPTVTGKSKGDEVRMLARGVYEEAKQGSYLSHLLRITVGKKKANNLGKLEWMNLIETCYIYSVFPYVYSIPSNLKWSIPQHLYISVEKKNEERSKAKQKAKRKREGMDGLDWIGV